MYNDDFMYLNECDGCSLRASKKTDTIHFKEK